MKKTIIITLLALLVGRALAKNTQLADSVVWKEQYGGITAYLYKDEIDTTYNKYLLSPDSEAAMRSYEKSSYYWDGIDQVCEALYKSLHVLTEAQVKSLLGEGVVSTRAIRIKMTLYKGKIVKTYFRLLGGSKVGEIPDAFILEADRGIRAVQFLGFDSCGLQHCNFGMSIFNRAIQDHTGVKSDLQVFIENQETLWVLDGKVLRDTKGLTIDMIDCREPYVPLGKALDMEPDAFESLSVISGKEAAEKYGTKETAQVVEIKTKEYSKERVSIDELALRMKRARLEKLGMGSKLDIDLKSIEEFVEKTPAAYKDLMDRFLKDPASLSKEEVANLYYGFAYTKDYDPLRVDLMTEPHKLYNEGKMQEAYDFCKKELQKAPVSLSLLWQISMIADELKMKEEAKKYYSTLKELYDAITASGNGYSKENAIKVIFISDEYAIFRDMMGLKRLQHTLEDGGYDRMTLDRGNKGETVTLWFDAHLSYDKIPHR